MWISMSNSWYLKPIDPNLLVVPYATASFFCCPKVWMFAECWMLETRRIWCIPKYLLLVPWPHAYCKNPHFQLIFQFLEHEIPFGKPTKNYGKSPFLMGKSTISMAMFNSYVKLPEGMSCVVDTFTNFIALCPKMSWVELQRSCW